MDKPVYDNFKPRNQYLKTKIAEIEANPKLKTAVEGQVSKKVDSIYFEYMEGTKGMR